MNKEIWKDRIKTALLMVGLAVITAIVYTGYQAYEKREVIVFAFTHPQLVENMKKQYASGEAELVKQMTTKQQSADDQLKEALVEQLKR